MRIALLGATSQVAKDMIAGLSKQEGIELCLFARRPQAVEAWLLGVGLHERHVVAGFDRFDTLGHFDAIINFVGVGNPATAREMGATIFDITLEFDGLALNHVKRHPGCRYLFMSSGAAYHSDFSSPATDTTESKFRLNAVDSRDWYGIAKLHAECRHRALPELAIVDIRLFNYFSHTMDMNARFLATDMFRAIRDKTLFHTSPDNIVRDYLHPDDFRQLVMKILFAGPVNLGVDAYSRQPVDKLGMLECMHKEFGLNYELTSSAPATFNATGLKPFYYSLSRKAERFSYAPSMNSMDCIRMETRLAIENGRKQSGLARA
jgi:nucleoside-diphosphate-sugar epimerase